MEENKNRFSIMGERLLALRKKKGLTQKQISDKIGCTEPSYRTWEHGRGVPDTAYLIELALLYDFSCDYLLGISDYTSVGNKEISTITGLTNKSIQQLRKLNKEDIPVYQQSLFALNTLLENQENGNATLWYIAEYITNRFKYFSVWSDHREFAEDVELSEEKAVNSRSACSMPINNVNSMFMVLIQECLQNLKREYKDRRNNNGKRVKNSTN